MRKVAKAIGAALRWLVMEAIGVGELLMYAALGLIALGFWDLWRPGAYIVPGAVMLWAYLPQRQSFIERPKIEVRRDG